MKKGKYYEEKTAKLVQKHNPQAQVFQGIRIKGKLSKISREVDVHLVDPAQYDQIIFECKDHKAKVGIELVEALVTKLEDLDAIKAAIVSNSGFTKGAFNMAKAKNIDLLSLVDTDDPHIRTNVYAPNIIEDFYVESGGFHFEGIPNRGIPGDTTLIKDDDNYLTWVEILAKRWNTNEMKRQPQVGMYTIVLNSPTVIDAGGNEASMQRVEIRYVVSKRYYVRNLKLLETQGIYNVQVGTFQTSSLKAEPVAVKDLSDPNKWQVIDESTAKAMQAPFWMTCVSPMPDKSSDTSA